MLETADEASELFARSLSGLCHEELWLCGLDEECRPVGLCCVARGFAGGLEICAGEVLRRARETGCPAFLLAHNHPSGDPRPSIADWLATKTVVEVACGAGLEHVDHLVIGAGVYVSLRSLNEPLFLGGEP